VLIVVFLFFSHNISLFSAISFQFLFNIFIHTVFKNSGFKRTLCGSTWLSLTGTNNAFNDPGTSTARYGCCPPGSYMSNPELNPFVEANACSTCPSNQFATTTSDNDDLSCCATVAGGTCTACASAVASGCTVVTCNTGKVNIDNDATNGCEVSCAAVTGGTCTACTSAVASGCTAVTCYAGGYINVDNDATNGCEIDPVPNGDGSSASNPGTLRRVVSDWIAGGTLKDAVVAKYGEIENWSTSEVTNLAYVFYGKSSFNADISKWVVSSVTTLERSTSFLANC
jgi:hypothetical protein